MDTLPIRLERCRDVVGFHLAQRIKAFKNYPFKIHKSRVGAQAAEIKQMTQGIQQYLCWFIKFDKERLTIEITF